MNPLIKLKTIAQLLLIAVSLACFALSPRAQAVTTDPEDYFPNNTTAVGQLALFNLTTGANNTANGYQALYFNTSGSNNTATGIAALPFNTTGSYNTASGVYALFHNTTGYYNTANGEEALYSNIQGRNNTANGFQALYSNTTGNNNTAFGVDALLHNAGSGNVGLGTDAGKNLTTGSGNVCIGVNVLGVAGESNTTRIRNVYSSVASGRAVYINSDNKIGTLASTRRVKNDIKPMDKASEAVLALKPVSFRYKKEIDPAGISQFGLVAEDVEKVNSELVVRDKEGKPYSVRYEAVNAMLLNEFLKEHKAFLKEQRKVEEQGAMIARQQKQIDALTAGLQKVSAQLTAASPSLGGLEASKFAAGRIRRGGPAPQVANNP